MQRRVVKLTGKSPGDSSKVSVLLNDYEDADKSLTKVGLHSLNGIMELC